MIVASKKCTFRRWWNLVRSPFSQLRTLEYEAIGNIELNGDILDIGGTKGSGYHHLFAVKGRISTLNISSTHDGGADILADLNRPLAIADESFDVVLSFNTFEHVYSDLVAIKESIRVLKYNGKFHFFVPFLFNVHGSPCDWHRHTAFWWNDALLGIGLDNANFTIEPLLWDQFAVGAGFFEFYFEKKCIRNFIRGAFSLPGVIAEQFLGCRKDRAKLDVSPLGYYISGCK